MVSVVLFRHSSSLIKIPEIFWYTKNSVIMYVRKTRQYKEGFLRFGNKKISLRLVVKRRQKNRKKLEQESDISSIWMKWDLFHIIHIFLQEVLYLIYINMINTSYLYFHIYFAFVLLVEHWKNRVLKKWVNLCSTHIELNVFWSKMNLGFFQFKNITCHES